MALGAYIEDAQWDATATDQYAALVGAPPAIVMWYQDWAHDFQTFNTAKMNAVVARGAMPLITWEPWDYTAGPHQPDYALQNILSGKYDAWIRKFARDAAVWDKPFYLRFAHEMNGDWYPWSPGVSGNTSAQYVATWRYVWNIFQQEGATKTRWVWSPSGLYPGSALLGGLYPGDQYVDWTSPNAYNWGTTQTWSQWTDLTTILVDTYNSIASITQKPMIIGETASAEQGGSKAEWITQGMLTELPTRFPLIRAVVWFNAKRETDWRVNSSPPTLAAFTKVATSPMYQGKLI